MLMFKQLLNKLHNMDLNIKKITKNGFRFALSVCLISMCILLVYDYIYSAPNLYYIGLSLFKTSLYFAIEFVICAFAFDTLKGQKI